MTWPKLKIKPIFLLALAAPFFAAAPAQALPRTEAKTSAVRPAEMTPPVELGDGQTLLVVDDATAISAPTDGCGPPVVTRSDDTTTQVTVP